ncbi:MAG: UDP-N-acetylmuramate--L-alanyl-gamma-D-glutamyl-meso-2,6-diaminoheptandioate ligase [Gemmatimonadaceae bacterium]|nr:UDP-N-acetylmuramate--L-alanyl-gamma-D-glutamyl-meso-2,6-diaminoheptandioate ligase [Gemmatimonadaceae bacterium]
MTDDQHPAVGRADDNGVILTDIEPGAVRRVHLVGVGGTGMGAFAGMLKAAGYDVTGSDENVYPPMSDMLRAWGIDVFTPYSALNLDRARPDLAIVGNVIRRTNPEAVALRERCIAQMSFPAAFGALATAGRHSVVIAGTHGKTTTTALLGHVLVAAGLDPTFLVGGVTVNYGANFRLGKGQHVVVEGDEYDTAYWDKGPKFLHYRARTALLTSIEFDHADIYRDLPHYETAFARLVASLPDGGWLGVSASYPRAVEIARAHARARVVTYAYGRDADFRADDARFGTEGARFRITEREGERAHLLLPMSGFHNLENATGVYAAARSLGLSPEAIVAGFATFHGVKRRQEPRGEVGGVLVIDDFAHHPTAVRETITAIRQRYPTRRLWAVFEPRSNTSRRNIHQEEYAAAFDGADLVSIRLPEPHDKVPPNERLDVWALVKAIDARGIAASALADANEMVHLVASGAKANDVVLVMSNGAFGGFIPMLLSALESPPSR